MLATLARSGSIYTTGNVQSYDVWGGVRSGSSTEDQGYVATLGHRNDGESNLTYMRARYYEPSTGRFVSQDKARDGQNWYIYANNDPVNIADSSGNAPGWLVALLAILTLAIGYLVGELIGYLMGVQYWQLDDPTFKGVDTTTRLGAMLVKVGISVTAALALAVFGPKTYAYTTGLIAKLGIAGAIGFIFGLYVGFLESTYDFIDYEDSK